MACLYICMGCQYAGRVYLALHQCLSRSRGAQLEGILHEVEAIVQYQNYGVSILHKATSLINIDDSHTMRYHSRTQIHP